ncbi:MAG: sigma-54-dependent transcriptional regulator [Acidobacteriota bacterium]
MNPRVLLAEDRASLRRAVAEVLVREGFEVVEAAEGRAAMAIVEEGGYDLALLDLKLPVHTGLELLRASRDRWPLAPVVLLTAYGSVETAVEAMKGGAADFLSKPVDPDHLLLVVRRALDTVRQGRVHEALSADLDRIAAFRPIRGKSRLLLEAQEQAARVAPTSTTCLILGETGVGKELFARAIHDAGPRRNQPFVAVNCAALPETLLENELFGHEKGAFTGAHASALGKIEYAHGGTLFLDEIGEMGPALQAKLLRVLEDKSFTRVGGTRPIRVDVRVLCATHRDLSRMVRDGSFREDLFFRVSAFPIRIPPLRERPGDVEDLAEHFLVHFRRELGRPALSFTPEAISWMKSQPWPGNVRELMNRVERGAILAPADGLIGPEILAGGRMPPPGGTDPPPVQEEDPEAWLEAEERWRAREVLRRCGGDRRRAARLLDWTGSRLEAALAKEEAGGE